MTFSYGAPLLRESSSFFLVYNLQSGSFIPSKGCSGHTIIVCDLSVNTVLILLCVSGVDIALATCLNTHVIFLC